MRVPICIKKVFGVLSIIHLANAGFFMQFLRIRGGSKLVRADGTAYKEARFIEKTCKYGDKVSEQTISVKKPVLVTGAHDSGKNRFLIRLYNDERAIYGAKIKFPAVLLETASPLSSWANKARVGRWFDSVAKANRDNVTWASLNQEQRIAQLPRYIAKTKAVVFVYDVHQLTDGKLQIAYDCLLAAPIYVISARDEQSIPPNLQEIMLAREPQIFRLRTNPRDDDADEDPDSEA